MKSYLIIDGEVERSIGVLLYYEKDNSYIIELEDTLDEWNAPLMFAPFVKRDIYTIPREICYLWVKERVVPSSRQNIDDILAHHNLKSYDEMRILEISGGRCSQDDMYIRRINKLPDYVVERAGRNVTECFISDESHMICFFADETVRKIDINELTEPDDVVKVAGNKALFETVKIGAGGYCITFNDSIDIPASVLYMSGAEIPLKPGDFMAFIRNDVLDTTQSCELLECSRQNLAYMIKKDRLRPLREEMNGNLYLKGDIIRSRE